MESKFFLCECNGEGILVTRNEEEKEYYFSYLSSFHISFWQRLKTMWNFVFKNHWPESNFVILDQSSAEQMIDFLSGVETSQKPQTKLERNV